MSRRRIQRSTHAQQRGMSLVEVMVAMVAGLVLMLGAFQVFTSSKQTYRVQESLARLQENGRFAVMQLREEMRMAGFAGCITHVNNLLDPTGTGYSDDLFDLGRPVFGWEATGTDSGDTLAVTTFDPNGVALNQWSGNAGSALTAELQDRVVPGTDVVIIKRAENRSSATASGNTPANAATINLTGASGVPQSSIVLVTDCAGADVFQNTQAATGSTLSRGAGGQPGNLAPGTAQFSHQYSDNMEIYTYAIDAYFVGIGVSGRPSLMRLRLGGGMPVDPATDIEELVEGIDNLQWLYGEDTNSDLAVDRYVAADDVTDWGNVIALRGAMLVTAVNPSLREAQGGAFDVNGTAVTMPDDRRQRQVFTTTIALRNLLP